MRRVAIGGALVAASLLLAAPVAAKPAPKPPSFKVEMEYIQTRDWTYTQQQVGTDCSSSSEGNGSERADLKAKGIFNLQRGRRGFAGFGAGGTHTRTGTMSHTTGTPNFPGADCGGPQTTTQDPVTGCGPKPALLSNAAVHFVGKTFVLQWESPSVPDFTDCPYFEGANEASSANALPPATYRDVDATGVSRKDLLKATKRRPAVATGNAEIARTETCANLEQPCAPGVTYNASATVKTFVKLYFTPKKR